MTKNRAAQSLGRRGGRANTPAQQAARLRNAQKGGRPADFLVFDDGHGSLTLSRRDGAPATLTLAAIQFLARWLAAHHPGMILSIPIDDGIIHYIPQSS